MKNGRRSFGTLCLLLTGLSLNISCAQASQIPYDQIKQDGFIEQYVPKNEQIYLPAQAFSVFKEETSDHLPQFYPVPALGNNTYVFAFNVLNQAAKKEKFANNGFCKTETQDQYVARLKKLPEFLADVIKSNPEKNILIALQEFPSKELASENLNLVIDQFSTFLNLELEEENVQSKAFRQFHSKTEGNSFSFMTLVPQKLHPVALDTTGVQLKKQAGRYNGVAFTNESGAKSHFYNCHFKWFPEDSENRKEDFFGDVAALATFNAAQVPVSILSGDFNFDISKINWSNSKFAAANCQNTSLVSNYPKHDSARLETNDGIIVYANS